MKQIIYRILAGLIVIAAIFTAFYTISEREFTEGFPFGIAGAVLGFLLIVPTFTVYALCGEAAGNRVLVPLMKLLNLPDTLVNRFAQRFVELPKDLQQTPRIETPVSKESLPPGEPGT